MKIFVAIVGGLVCLAVVVAAVAAMIIVLRPPKRTPEQKKKARKRSALAAIRVFAKIGICVGTFLAANLLEVFLGYFIRGTTPNDSVFTGVGIPGAIPKAIFWGTAFIVMWRLCAKYNKHFEENYGKYFEEDDEPSEPQAPDESSSEFTCPDTDKNIGEGTLK